MIPLFYEESYKSSPPTAESLSKPFITSVIFLPSVISSDSITFLVIFLFGALGERFVVDLMVWDAPGGGGAVFEDGGDVGLCTEAKQDRWINILLTFISSS